MKQLKQILAIARFYSSSYFRVKIWWLTNMLSPLSFYIALNVIGGARLSDQALGGALAMLLFSPGANALPQIFLSHKRSGLRDMFVAAPISSLIYALGGSLSVLTLATPPFTVFLVLALTRVNLDITKILALLSILAMAWIIGTMMGFTLSTYVSSPAHVSAITNTLNLAMAVIPPVYYPLATVPEIYRPLALIPPTTHLSQLVKVYMGMAAPIYNPILHWLAIIGYGATFTVLTSIKSQWREK